MPNQNCTPRVGIHRLGHVEAQRRPLDEAEPGHVQAQAAADGVGHRAERVAVDVGVADVVEGGPVDVAQADDVVAAIVGQTLVRIGKRHSALAHHTRLPCRCARSKPRNRSLPPSVKNSPLFGRAAAP